MVVAKIQTIELKEKSSKVGVENQYLKARFKPSGRCLGLLLTQPDLHSCMEYHQQSSPTKVSPESPNCWYLQVDLHSQKDLFH